jgi:MraZ protein
MNAHAGTAAAGALAGHGHNLQIWEPEHFRAELAAATEKVRALKKQLGTRVAADGPHGARE